MCGAEGVAVEVAAKPDALPLPVVDHQSVAESDATQEGASVPASIHQQYYYYY
jgi:hypothetical protein